MNEAKAREILTDIDSGVVHEGNHLKSLGPYIDTETFFNERNAMLDEVVLDGAFTVEQLEALVWWVKNMIQK